MGQQDNSGENRKKRLSRDNSAEWPGREVVKCYGLRRGEDPGIQVYGMVQREIERQKTEGSLQEK